MQDITWWAVVQVGVMLFSFLFVVWIMVFDDYGFPFDRKSKQTIEIINYIFIIACSLADSFWIKTNKKKLEKTKKDSNDG